MTVFYYKGWTQDQTKKEIFRVRSRQFTNIKLPHPLPVELGHMTLSALQYVHQLGNWPNSLSRILTVVQPLSRVWFFATPWTAAHQASLSFAVSRSLLKLMSIESVMPSNHFILSPTSLLALSLSQPHDLFQWFDSTSDGQRIGASASASVFPMNIQGSFPLRLTGLISLQSKGLSGVFSSTTIWTRWFFSAQPFSLWPNSHIHTWLLEKP